MDNRIIVVGHKNPDTDSICSAIAYANLKNQISSEEYIAKRAGEISEETRFVLEKFNVEVPELIEYLGIQAADIEIKRVEGVQRSFSLKKAWEHMKKGKFATIPVTKKNKLEGLLSVKDIATANMDVYDNHILAESKTSYKNILESLNGSILVGDENSYVEGGKILIAAADVEMLGDNVEKNDIVILSNRKESQICAIEMGAACIIVCLGAKVSDEILELAKRKKCIVISTSYDTYTVSRLINQSTPIEFCMRSDDLITFQIDDTTDDISRVMAKVRHRDFPVMDIYGNYLGMISRRSLLDTKKKRVIMVDHNERMQAVEGLDDAEILEIIDHHKLGNPETMTPIYFRNQPVGCTATIIYQIYQEHQITIEPQIAGILCAAIISDTLMFRSPTCTEFDKDAAEKLAKKAGIIIELFANELFKAGSNLKDKTAEEIINQDYKEFIINEFNFAVTQNTFMHQDNLNEAREIINGYLESNISKMKVDMLFVMLTHILEESTLLLCYGEAAVQIAEDAFGMKAENNALFLKDVVSRKKQLIPAIMASIEKLSN